MSLKVVGIIASPRKGMNTDTLVTKVLDGAQSVGVTVEKIYFNDLEIKPCQACSLHPRLIFRRIGLSPCKRPNHANNNAAPARRGMGNLRVRTLPHRPLHRRFNHVPSRSLRSLPNSEDNQKMGNRITLKPNK